MKLSWFVTTLLLISVTDLAAQQRDVKDIFGKQSGAHAAALPAGLPGGIKMPNTSKMPQLSPEASRFMQNPMGAMKGMQGLSGGGMKMPGMGGMPQMPAMGGMPGGMKMPNLGGAPAKRPIARKPLSVFSTRDKTRLSNQIERVPVKNIVEKPKSNEKAIKGISQGGYRGQGSHVEDMLNNLNGSKISKEDSAAIEGLLKVDTQIKKLGEQIEGEASITVYTGNNCPRCQNLFVQFEKGEVNYSAVNIDESEMRMKEFEAMNKNRGDLPLVIVDGKMIPGYQTQRIRQVIRKFQNTPRNVDPRITTISNSFDSF